MSEGLVGLNGHMLIVLRKDGTSSIFGNTLNHLVVDTDNHAACSAEALSPTELWTGIENTVPCRYNPYPNYNSTAWKKSHQGSHVECDGPDGHIADMLVFSGHHKELVDPPMGSNQVLHIDSNMCFERKTRFGPYGYEAEDGDDFMERAMKAMGSSKSKDWDTVNWGHLQKKCYQKNAARYRKAGKN